MAVVDKVRAALHRLDGAASLGAIVARDDASALRAAARSTRPASSVHSNIDPAISLPAGCDPATGLPFAVQIAVQIAASRWHDHVVLAVASQLEKTFSAAG